MIGKTLAHYEILAKIGQGGMGEVYRALDRKLNREIALKILPVDMAQAPGRLERFDREAKAVATLKHPNIVTIYSVEEVDDLHFITMELVEGKRLTSLLPKNGFPLHRVFDIAIPLADAVSSAHAHGITHRDLKPDNIMIDGDGRLRVLDFGLAKLQDRSDSDNTTLAMTVDAVTEEGKILGTVAYMSPEQAEGKTVDSRSDIFSLGTMIYELVTGIRPFQGDTGISTIGAILKDDPATVTELDHTLPRHLGRIIRRCLAKDPNRRYQTAVDLRNDLEDLREEMESGETSAVGAVDRDQRHRFTGRQLVLGMGVLAVAIAGLGIGLNRLLPRTPDPTGNPTLGEQMEMIRLTHTGDSGYSAAISPDGKYLVHLQRGDPGRSLWLLQISTSRRVQIVPSSDATLMRPTFSPDGEWVYFVKREKGEDTGALFRIPVLGGSATRVLEDVGGRISFSPDGNSFVFLRDEGDLNDLLMVANIDGSNERELARRTRPLEYHRDPAWSSDGQVVAAAGTQFGHKDFHLVVVPIEGGPERKISSESWGHIEAMAWLPGGSGLVMQAFRKNESFQLWEIPYPEGPPRRITNDFNSYSGVSLTADGQTLVTQLMESDDSLWVTTSGMDARPEQITPGSSGYNIAGISWTPDGRIVYGATAVEGMDLWISEKDGAKPVQLTFGGSSSYPSVSPDGQTIVYCSTSSPQSHIWRMNSDGSNPTQLTFGDGERHPKIHPQGLSILYIGETPGGHVLFKIPLQGGEPVLISDKTLSNAPPAISPDGLSVAVMSYDADSNRWGNEILQFDGGTTIQSLDLESTVIQWSTQGNAIEYSVWENGCSNIWSRPLNGEPPEQLTFFKSQQIRYFAWAPDGKTLAVNRDTSKWDVVLLKNFQ